MSKINRWKRLLFVAVLLATVPAVSAQEGTQAPQTLDAEYAQLAERVPGFGGLYLDEKGTTHVYLKDLTRRRQVQGLGQSVRVHQGEYDFRDLFAWKEKLRQQLAQPGAVYLDIDEKRNRLLLGVERGFLKAFSQKLQGFLRENQVPAKALIIEAAEPIVPLVLLTDPIRPVSAGVQIQNPAGGICTLGVNAIRFVTMPFVRGFVTNSHCTATRSVVDGAVFSQSTSGAVNRIGVETVDPPFFVAGCPSGRVCRFSDAAFVAYDSEALSARGHIAKPRFCVPLGGTLEIDPALPSLAVTGITNPPVNAFLEKVGRTTGCTTGFQVNTCVDANVAGSSITMLCQNRVAGVAAPGDSGSPVYRRDGNTALLAGILWGGSSGAFVYSQWLVTSAELGGLVSLEMP